MKVDIMTRHSVPNYGSLLQSYATEQVLNKLGIESEIIDYTRYDERNRNLAKSLIKGKKWDNNFFARMIYLAIQIPNYSKMYKRFKKYRKNFIKVTNIQYGCEDELKENIPEADIYASGSDQIWGRIGKSEYDEAYFLKFAEGKRKIALSSSFGKEKLTENLEKNIHSLLDDYETILVREDSAKQILKDKGFKNVEQILDPTFWLEKSEWEDLADKSKLKYKDYILVYQLHDNKEFDKYAKKFAKIKNKKLLRISPSIYHIVRSGKLIYLPNQYDFLYLIKNAKYVLTDSFHATAFSIIFNKQFIDILPKNNTGTRIESILKLSKINDRILRDYNDFEKIENNIDYNETNKIIDKERINTLNLVSKAIFKDCKNIDNVMKNKKCTGCMACVNICPTNAIEMKENEEGFFIPIINKSKCINCSKCQSVCQALKKENTKKLDIQKGYAIKAKNKEMLIKSASGAAFSTLANYIIENGGVVYGAAYNEILNVETIRVEDKENLNKLYSSKYLQSFIGNSFKNVEEDLKNGKKVLFSGTPCQVQGLKLYLGKKYENLITMDLICHGVPNQKLFDKYISFIEKKYNSKIETINFRDKTRNNWGENSLIILKNGKNFSKRAMNDYYYQPFIKGVDYRECCYNCDFANLNRVGDITIGDYWGIKKDYPDFYDKKGVSLIIVNTENGAKYLEKLKNEIEIIEIDINKAKKWNNNLNKPTSKSNVRNNAYNQINNKNIEFDKYSKKYLGYKYNIKESLKEKVPYDVRNKIKNK